MGKILTPLNSCVFSIAAFVLFSCSQSPKVESNPDAARLNVDGSSTVYPITEAIANEYARSFNAFNIDVSVSGTGGGFRKFAQGEIDISNASRAISQEEVSRCERNGIEYIELPIATDGIAVVINSANNWVDNLSVAELSQVWRQDGANNWSDIRSGWPEEPIVRYSPGEASGTFDFFKEAILDNQDLHRDTKKSENDNLLVTGINSNEYSIGFFGLAYFSKNSDKLRLVPIDNGLGAISPDEQTVADGSYQPLSRPIYIYANKMFAQSKEGKHFLNYYLDNAGRVAEEVGYVPLPTARYTAAKSTL